MSRSAWGYVFAIVAVALWGGNAVIGRAASSVDIPPVALNFARWTIALVVVLPFALRGLRRDRALYVRHWRFCLAIGLVAIAGFNTLYYIGLQTTTAVQGSLMAGALPAMVLTGAWLFFRSRITARQVAGIVLCFGGLVLIVGRGDPSVLLRLQLNVGDVWIMGAIVMWAAHILLLRKTPPGMDLMGFQVVMFVVGLVALVPLLAWEMATVGTIPLNPTTIALLAYVGVVASVFGFTLWNLGVLWAGSAAAGYLGNLYPVFGSLFAILFLGETFAWFHIAAAALILGGIVLATWMPARPAPVRPQAT